MHIKCKYFLLCIPFTLLGGCQSIFRQADIALSDSSVAGNAYESIAFVFRETGKPYDSRKSSDKETCIVDLEENADYDKVSLLKAVELLKICMSEKGWDTREWIIVIND